jgi:Flp pilus assembly protein TadG
MPTRSRAQHRRDDRGAAMVEFAFVGVLLVVLLFGIINMGVLLSFKQNLTQAASESARAGIAVVDDTTTAADERYTVVDAALEDTVQDHDKSCGTPGESTNASFVGHVAAPAGGMTCLRRIHDCDEPTDPFEGIDVDRADGDCLTVRITYDNTGTNRIMPAFPLIAALEPDAMSSQTTVRLVPVAP